VTLNYANRVVFDGDREVSRAPRAQSRRPHRGLQIVSVETKRGTVVLTRMPRTSPQRETRQPVQIITNPPEMPDASRPSTRSPAGELIVAGHDPLVADRFQQVEPGIIKIA
jgi:hypothetical protein